MSTAPYGSWSSPITAGRVATAGLRLGGLSASGASLYWLEGRPAEGGRSVLMRGAADRIEQLTARDVSVRTRVHEYGGGAYLVRGERVIFVNFADQRLYLQAPGREPRPITPEAAQPGDRVPSAALRYADLVLDEPRRRLICVREDHRRPETDPMGVNEIVAVPLPGDPDSGDAGAGAGASRRGPEDPGAAGHPGEVLVSGHDFFAHPRLSPDGARLLWLAWDHPRMPWDGTQLFVAGFAPDGTLLEPELVAGGPGESIFQPEWSPDGEIHFVSDRSGWWNLYRSRNGRSEPLCPMEAEFGLPMWSLDPTTYAFESARSLVCVYNQHGISHLARLDLESLRLTPIPLPYTDLDSPQAAGEGIALLGSSPAEPRSVLLLEPGAERPHVLRRAAEPVEDPRYVSRPQALDYPTAGGETAHAFFYPPANPDFDAPRNELPPLIVVSHGGPTSATTASLDLGVQFWTSRGFAVLDVNYGGSTGYGRAYRERLNGAWGVVDVDDCAAGARHLVDRGLVDGRRLAIRGGSAGGYTTLCALAFRDLFHAGADYYGVSDLVALDAATHKFEARYNDSLIGPRPERAHLYTERSPIHFPERISCPVIFFQGLDDPVVPPDQSERMYAALRARGIPTAYLGFPGEQHGFRRAENIRRALEAELYFYGKVFGFKPADEIEPVTIENEERLRR